MKKCESCGMPLEDKTISKFDKHYCIYCQNQETGFLAKYEDVRKGSIEAAMKFLGKTKQEAENMADKMLSQLPRWERVLKK